MASQQSTREFLTSFRLVFVYPRSTGLIIVSSQGLFVNSVQSNYYQKWK